MQKSKRQIVKPGDILAISLPNGKFMYLKKYKAVSAFYDYITDEIIKDVEELKDKKIIFMTGVNRYVLSSGVWPKIGKIPFKNEKEAQSPLQCIYQDLEKRFKYYYDAKIQGDPSYKDCYNLEFVAAWSRMGIEYRLMHYIETKKDHPRMWDGWSFPNREFMKEAWKDLFNEDIIVDIKPLIQDADKSGRYKEIK